MRGRRLGRSVECQSRGSMVVWFFSQQERYNGFYVNLRGNLGSVIEKIENENSVCVVESLWRS